MRSYSDGDMTGAGALCFPVRGRTVLLFSTLFTFCSTLSLSNGNRWGYDQPQRLCKLSQMLQEGLFIRSSIPTGLDFVDEVLLASCSSLVIEPPPVLPINVVSGGGFVGSGKFAGQDVIFNDEDLTVLFHALEDMPHVQKLSLRNFPLSARAAPALVRLLRQSSSLRSLDLWNSSLTRHRDVFKDVLQALHAHQSMKHLNLGSNNLLDEHMATVASMLAAGGNIETLNLGDNSVTAIGLQILLQVVNATSGAAKPRQHFQKLVMSGNKRPVRSMRQRSNVRKPSDILPSLGDQFLAALSSFVTDSTAIQLNRFECDRCEISDRGLSDFANAIRNTTCPHLAVLHFRENDVGPEGLEALIQMARSGVLSDAQLAGNPRLSETIEDDAQVQNSMRKLQQVLAGNGLSEPRSAIHADPSCDVHEASDDTKTEAQDLSESIGITTTQKTNKIETISSLQEACYSIADKKSIPFHDVPLFSQLLRDISPTNEDFMQLWHQQQ